MGECLCCAKASNGQSAVLVEPAMKSRRLIIPPEAASLWIVQAKLDLGNSPRAAGVATGSLSPPLAAICRDRDAPEAPRIHCAGGPVALVGFLEGVCNAFRKF